MRFTDRMAYVTGAGSGIGRAAALRLASEGAYVVLMGRRPQALDATRELIGAASAAVPVDVTSRPDVDRLVASALGAYGAPDVVVHAAGQTVVGALDALSEDEWDRQLDVNLKSIYLLNRLLWPAMVAAGGGAVVTISSTAASAGFPNDAAYCASKGAVLALTRAMALDGAPVGIRVNAVAPGYIDTPNLRGYFDSQPDPAAAAGAAGSASPLGRMGSSAEVAAAIAFLASDDASFVTGTSLLVDGGVLARVPTS